MTDNIKEINAKEMEKIAGGTQAEIDELMAIINSRPEFLKIFNDSVARNPELDISCHIDSVLWDTIHKSCVTDSEAPNRYCYERFYSHAEIIELLNNYIP